MSSYEILSIIFAMFLAFITSGHIYLQVAITRWCPNEEPPMFLYFVFGIVAAVIMGFVSAAAIEGAAIIGGIVSVIAATPLTGFVWIFVLGGNKAFERILNGLIGKLESATISTGDKA